MIKQAICEKVQILHSDGFISDNEWCKQRIQFLNNNCQYYPSLLPINEVFKNSTWEVEKIEEYSVFTVAGRNAYKGLHILIEAIGGLKKEFPSIKLFIPGNMSYGKPVFLKKPTYMYHLEYLIKKYGISDSVIFLNKLSSEEMAQQFLKCNCFVMPSVIENHSSTLREAMFVGTPCISSFVGSVSELIEDNVNGYVYRYNDVVSLMNNIRNVFRSKKKSVEFSIKAKDTIKKMYSNNSYMSIFDIMEQVYKMEK